MLTFLSLSNPVLQCIALLSDGRRYHKSLHLTGLMEVRVDFFRPQSSDVWVLLGKVGGTDRLLGFCSSIGHPVGRNRVVTAEPRYCQLQVRLQSTYLDTAMSAFCIASCAALWAAMTAVSMRSRILLFCNTISLLLWLDDTRILFLYFPSSLLPSLNVVAP